MRRLNITVAAFSIFFLTAATVNAEDINSIFNNINNLVAQKNYPKALQELDWARKEIEKLNMARMQEFFPEALNDFKGGKLEANSALGFTNMERLYVKGSAKVKLSLTGGTGEGAQALSGLSQLGRMAAMMNGTNASGNETTRIQGFTTVMETAQNGNISATVMLDSGAILKLEGSGGVKSKDLKQMVESLKPEEIEKYLKGSK